MWAVVVAVPLEVLELAMEPEPGVVLAPVPGVVSKLVAIASWAGIGPLHLEEVVLLVVALLVAMALPIQVVLLVVVGLQEEQFPNCCWHMETWDLQ